MKKILAIITTAVLVLCLFGCSKVKTSVFTASNFLDTPQNLSVANVNETNNYVVSYAQKEGETNAVISVDGTKSSYKTVLTTSTYNETACYLLETTLNIVGEVKIANAVTPLNDVISTKCYFLGVDKALSPLYSERIVKANSVIRTSPVNASTHTYKVCYYDYTIKTEYSGSSAKVSLTVNQKPDDDANFSSYQNHEFNNIANDVAYIDNEILLFAPRAMSLTSSTSKSFYTIDAVSVKNHKMSLTSVSAEPTKSIKPENYYNNGTKVTEILCYAVNFAIDSNASGSSITAYYADSGVKSENAKMIMASTTASYGLGTFTYTITETKRI